MAIPTPEIKSSPLKSGALKKFYLVFLIVAAFLIGLEISDEQEGSGTVRFLENHGREQAPQSLDWQILWDAIDQINQKYVDAPADPLKILYGAVGGAVGALEDPYSVFLPPKEASEFKEELKGNFEGIGAEIAIKNQKLVVVSPLDSSPALRAGIRAGDFIFKVDGEETGDLTLEEAVKKIRGPAGTKVTLTVYHKGKTEPVEIGIIRAKIAVKSLESEIKEYQGKKIGYLKLRRFGEDTRAAMEQDIFELLLKNVSGMILDLRNNPGGFLDTAVEVASFWVLEGETVVIQKFGDGTEQVFRGQGGARLNGLPTAVLINGGSASASEIVAGALHDHGLAKLLGEKSFGKGSVQEVIDLRGGADLKLTVAKWLTPKGHDLNKEGLEPEIKVELTDEDFNADRDPQLDKALEILIP